jgi:signal recognition particle GTPase
MREIKLALLEADVNFKVVKDFINKVTERAVGSEVLESLVPAQQIVKIVNEDLKHVMPNIKAPTLMIWGELDTATPLGDARVMEKLIKGSGVAVMKGCGHYSFLDNPRQLFAMVDAFLNS